MNSAKLLDRQRSDAVDYYADDPRDKYTLVPSAELHSGDYRMEFLVRDVLDIADALGFDRFHLVGHDWGSLVAWYVAGAAPERILTLNTISAPHPDAAVPRLIGALDRVRRIETAVRVVPEVARMFAMLAPIVAAHDRAGYRDLGRALAEDPAFRQRFLESSQHIHGHEHGHNHKTQDQTDQYRQRRLHQESQRLESMVHPKAEKIRGLLKSLIKILALLPILHRPQQGFRDVLFKS